MTDVLSDNQVPLAARVPIPRPLVRKELRGRPFRG